MDLITTKMNGIDLMDKTLKEMSALYKQLENLDENLPADLQRIILINTKLLQPLGKMYSQASKDFKHANSKRKYGYGSLLVHSSGTGVEKQGQAEIGIKEARDIESDAEGEMIRWKYAYDSTKELIQSQKLVLRSLMTELQNTNDM